MSTKETLSMKLLKLWLENMKTGMQIKDRARKTICPRQTGAVFSKASGIAAASRFSGIENGSMGIDSGTGKTGTPEIETACKWL